MSSGEFNAGGNPAMDEHEGGGGELGGGLEILLVASCCWNRYKFSIWWATWLVSRHNLPSCTWSGKLFHSENILINQRYSVKSNVRSISFVGRRVNCNLCVCSLIRLLVKFNDSWLPEHPVLVSAAYKNWWISFVSILFFFFIVQTQVRKKHYQP